MLAARATGVGRYADTLLETLRRCGLDPLVLTAERREGHPLFRGARVLSRRSRPAPLAGDRTVLSAAAQLFREAQAFFDLHGRPMPVSTDAEPGVMHWTYPVPLRLEGWRNLYTVHDAIPLAHPSLTPINGARYRRILHALANDAAGFVTVSKSARTDIVTTLGCPRGFVTVIPQGVAPAAPGGRLPAGLEPGGFFLTCGTVEPRKNLVALARAHAASGSARPLVIAGPDGWRADEILSRLAAMRGVVRLGYLARDDLEALTAAARALLMPSLAEGFGLPVAEAMAQGTPVMTSAGGALAETAGGAGLLADPGDVQAMAAAIRKLDRDDDLAARLAAAGRRRAGDFNLDAYGEALKALYREVSGRVP